MNEAERSEPNVILDRKGRKTSTLGASRDLIGRFQQNIEIEPQHLWNKLRQAKLTYLRLDQEYHDTLLDEAGADLLCAHFLCARHASVKFVNDSDWHKTYQHMLALPIKYQEGMFIEAIDASNTSLLYEGFDYFRGLKHLRYLNLSGCHRVDDHCLHKLTVHLPTLEHLDISNCPSISERGLASLYNLKNLKKLSVENMEGVTLKQLVCLLLEEEIPGLLISGVEYNSEKIDQELEADREKYEKRYTLQDSKNYADPYLTENIPQLKIMERVLKLFPKSSKDSRLAWFFPPTTYKDKVRDEF